MVVFEFVATILRLIAAFGEGPGSIACIESMVSSLVILLSLTTYYTKTLASLCEQNAGISHTRSNATV